METAAWFPGAMVGRYQLMTPLASGGMAEIWLARQPGLHGFEKLVVIKRMVGALEDDPDHVEMFLAEARLAAGLTHPNVVQIYELGEDKGSLFIVMEFIDGESLSTVWKTGLRLDLPVAGPLAAQIIAWSAEGLHYAHTRVNERGEPLCIVHRDVSPQNLLITYDGGIKLVDFGIAKVANEGTASGKLKGKLAYMSPEQSRAERLDARSDVFSLGVVFFELVTRSRVFPTLDDLEIFKRLVGNAPMPRAQERRPDIPDALDRIISKALAVNPNERFASARDFQVAIEDWLLKTGRRTTSADVSDYMRGLFKDRIAQRRALIDAARRGDLTPAGARGMFSGAGSSGNHPALTPSGSDGMPVVQGTAISGSGDISLTFASSKKTSPLVWAVGVAAVLATGVLATVLAVRGSHATAEAAPTPPPVARCELEVESTPDAVAVVVDDVSRGQTRVKVQDLAPGTHTVAVSKVGYLSQQKTISLQAGERLALSFALAGAEGAPAVPDAGKPVEAKPVVRVATGKLSINTLPWTTVYLGTRKLGETPLMNVTLPAGKQVLKLVNPEQNLTSSVEVQIVPNETVTKTLTLQ